MSVSSKDLSVIAFYLSEYDMRAVKELGYETRTEAFKKISVHLGRDNNYLKLRRDEFDVLTSSPRNGWRNRPVAPDVQAMYNELIQLTYEEITEKVKKILGYVSIELRQDIYEQVEEQQYNNKVHQTISENLGRIYIASKPKIKKKERQYGSVRYVREPKVAANALCNADYFCEVNGEHETFIRKTNGKPYTEPHHLVPMKAQANFSVSLDVENNVVSLCSHCHNLLHYGADIDEILKPLYESRKELLHKVGIYITYDELIKYYK